MLSAKTRSAGKATVPFTVNIWYNWNVLFQLEHGSKYITIRFWQSECNKMSTSMLSVKISQYDCRYKINHIKGIENMILKQSLCLAIITCLNSSNTSTLVACTISMKGTFKIWLSLRIEYIYEVNFCLNTMYPFLSRRFLRIHTLYSHAILPSIVPCVVSFPCEV